MIYYGYANLCYFKFLTKFVLFRFICNLDICCYIINFLLRNRKLYCRMDKTLLVQGCASPDAVIRKLVRSYQYIAYIISKKSKLTCLLLYKEKKY